RRPPRSSPASGSLPPRSARGRFLGSLPRPCSSRIQVTARQPAFGWGTCWPGEESWHARVRLCTTLASPSHWRKEGTGRGPSPVPQLAPVVVGVAGQGAFHAVPGVAGGLLGGIPGEVLAAF